MSQPEIRVHDDPKRGAFIIEVDGVEAGLAEYHLRGDLQFFVHTEIGDDYEGKGLGQVLVRTALDEVRGTGRRIVPACPFVDAFIRRHPEYGDMVDEEVTERVRAKRAAASD